MSAPATYGDLLDRAGFGISRGVAWVERLQLGDRDDARRAIGEFYATLRALEEHTWQVLEPHRVPGIATTPEPDPRERAAVTLISRLQNATDGRGIIFRDEGVGTSPWAFARRSIRAATDLLATHMDATRGTARTPDVDAVLRDPAARQAALARVGELTATLLAGEDHLALRAIQAGVPRGHAKVLLPGLADVAAAARDVAGDGPIPELARLTDLTVANPGIRAAEQAGEFADRMLRLRRIAWVLPQIEHPSVDTLKAFATLGVAVHAHALAHRGYPPATLRQVPRPESAVTRLAARARAWAGVSKALFSYCTPSRLDPIVAGDVERVSAILRDFAPLTGAQPDLKSMDRRHLGQALTAAVEMTADIARWSSRTLERIAATDQLHLPARELSGDQVTDDPNLVRAKLADRLARAPHEDISRLHAAYEGLARGEAPGPLGAGGLTLRAEPLRTDPTATTTQSAGLEPIHRVN